MKKHPTSCVGADAPRVIVSHFDLWLLSQTLSLNVAFNTLLTTRGSRCSAEIVHWPPGGPNMKRQCDERVPYRYLAARREK
jgi:hypothetical protein